MSRRKYMYSHQIEVICHTMVHGDTDIRYPRGVMFPLLVSKSPECGSYNIRKQQDTGSSAQAMRIGDACASPLLGRGPAASTCMHTRRAWHPGWMVRQLLKIVDARGVQSGRMLGLTAAPHRRPRSLSVESCATATWLGHPDFALPTRLTVPARVTICEPASSRERRRGARGEECVRSKPGPPHQQRRGSEIQMFPSRQPERDTLFYDADQSLTELPREGGGTAEER
ncbi:hypothetical protein LY78DRAFT_157690 [Colletotrichum sublineola]|nr:hypothetical protein LY78DRAFT_157690 [Colletotrichum sublineola]